jgi:hypothetical protein
MLVPNLRCRAEGASGLGDRVVSPPPEGRASVIPLAA